MKFMRRRKLGVDLKNTAIILLSSFLLISCSSSVVYYEKPIEFKDPQKKIDFYIQYSGFLTGKKIFLDPGHGGEDRWNVGPQNLTIEADANLNVALALKDFLERAGVEVVMSRDKDMTVGLKHRSIMADSSGAELFISIHHNAPGKGADQGINYTSTYYHAEEQDYEYEPCERDLAKYVQRDLAYAMRNPGGLRSFDGTHSDYWIYPGMGFSVLRITKIPSILVECGFFSNLHEEQRLAIEEFNKIEAWGIFRGIARYYAAGIPLIDFIMPEDTFSENNLDLLFTIRDTTGIDPESIAIYFDSLATSNFNFDTEAGLVELHLSNVETGEHVIRIIVANKSGNHSFPFEQKIFVIDPSINKLL